MARPYFTDKQKLIIYLKFNGKCSDCGEVLAGYWYKGESPKREKQTFTIVNGNIHHIIPIYRGGKHNINNWILLCKKCHKKRHKILIREDLKIWQDHKNQE